MCNLEHHSESDPARQLAGDPRRDRRPMTGHLLKLTTNARAVGPGLQGVAARVGVTLIADDIVGYRPEKAEDQPDAGQHPRRQQVEQNPPRHLR